jgi:hypothetical protein
MIVHLYFCIFIYHPHSVSKLAFLENIEHHIIEYQNTLRFKHLRRHQPWPETNANSLIINKLDDSPLIDSIDMARVQHVIVHTVVQNEQFCSFILFRNRMRQHEHAQATFPQILATHKR